jgi:hypothetical protein
MVCLGCCLLFLLVVANSNYEREGDRGDEVTFNHLPTSVIRICFPMFRFRFHLQLAAQQHRSCIDIVSIKQQRQDFVQFFFGALQEGGKAQKSCFYLENREFMQTFQVFRLQIMGKSANILSKICLNHIKPSRSSPTGRG